jgi:peptide deformylase
MTPMPMVDLDPAPRIILLRKYMVDYPDVGKILRKLAETVTVFDSDLRRLVVDMFATMYRNNGVGLAANQIGLWLKVAVVDITSGCDPAAKIVLINPEIVESSGSQVDWEGCLSLPGFRERVTRPMHVKVRARNEQGGEYTVTGEGLLARALVHEIDHLNGKVYLARVSGVRRSIVEAKIKKLKRQGKW